ncbi:MAG: segregation/condensation protein A [Clostridia bacterium]|nr:segregation/condensation protein A [Clostridia bacterium]
MELTYKIEQFEGPLDLLLTLVQKNKMNIEDIQISVICDQYMAYIESMQEMNIDVSAEFIVMASELMYIKSKILLPRVTEDEEDPREALAAALLEYQRAKQASEKLQSMYSIYMGRMEKDTDEISPDRSYVADHDISLLSLAFMRIMNNVEVTDEEATEKIRPLISKRTVSVSEKVYSVLRFLLRRGGKARVIECFNGIRNKHELVAMFMAVLEMLKTSRIFLKEDFTTDEGVIDLADNIFIELNHDKIIVANGEEQ